MTADEIKMRTMTNDDIELKVIYEPPPDAQSASPTPSVEYDSRIHPRYFIPTTLTALLQHCCHPWNRRLPWRYLMKEGRHERFVRVLRQLAEKHTHAADDNPECSNLEIRISVAMIRRQSHQSEDFDIDSASSFESSTSSKGTVRLIGDMLNQDWSVNRLIRFVFCFLLRTALVAWWFWG